MKLSLQERDDLRFDCAVTKEKLLKLIQATVDDERFHGHSRTGEPFYRTSADLNDPA